MKAVRDYEKNIENEGPESVITLDNNNEVKLEQSSRPQGSQKVLSYSNKSGSSAVKSSEIISLSSNYNSCISSDDNNSLLEPDDEKKSYPGKEQEPGSMGLAH